MTSNYDICPQFLWVPSYSSRDWNVILACRKIVFLIYHTGVLWWEINLLKSPTVSIVCFKWVWIDRKLQENKKRGIGQCPIYFRTLYFPVRKHAQLGTNVDTWVKIWNHAWDHPGSCRSQINFKPRMNTDHFKLVLKRYNSHRGRASFQSLSISASPLIEVQSPLGFATMGLAANLGLATSRALTDSVSA